MRSCLPYADFVIYQKSCCDYNTATNFCLPEIFKYMRFLRCSGIYFFTWNLLLQFTFNKSLIIQSYNFTHSLLTVKFRFVVLSRTEQTLVKGEQSLVDFKDIVVLIFDEILNDDVEFV